MHPSYFFGFIIIFNLFVLTTSSRNTFLVSQVGRVGDDVIWQSRMPLLAGEWACIYNFMWRVFQEEQQLHVCTVASHEHFLLPFIPYILGDVVAHWAQLWSVKKKELPPREICSLIFLPVKWKKKTTQTSDVSRELTYIVEISSIFIKDGHGGGGVCVLPVWAWVWVRVGLGR